MIAKRNRMGIKLVVIVQGLVIAYILRRLRNASVPVPILVMIHTFCLRCIAASRLCFRSIFYSHRPSPGLMVFCPHSHTESCIRTTSPYMALISFCH
ncbi:hypothetical protein K461DRAFT_143747 [Myriangium duriaei CBS 260.36]|uniref:Uncharacterized protein n=1 Tax=Myriangium duriaei CBS 260.36 TaxID=1168546 RepID=A0A9P4IYJ2_9PEZI|nr:hypothetical protein K461DRAFT_143747 [Myriangium duriaei CBS 260.36]